MQGLAREQKVAGDWLDWASELVGMPAHQCELVGQRGLVGLNPSGWCSRDWRTDSHLAGRSFGDHSRSLTLVWLVKALTCALHNSMSVHYFTDFLAFFQDGPKTEELQLPIWAEALRIKVQWSILYRLDSRREEASGGIISFFCCGSYATYI
jgi:hypothetical protein